MIAWAEFAVSLLSSWRQSPWMSRTSRLSAKREGASMSGDRDELEKSAKLAAVEFLAAAAARRGAFERTNPIDFQAAFLTLVVVFGGDAPTRERQRMAAFFAWNPQVA